MGGYADMMLEGYACEACGEVFHDDAAAGFPRYCDGCEPEDLRPNPARARSIPCPGCARKFHSAFALAQHRTAKVH
jgi:hypothetical protein